MTACHQGVTPPHSDDGGVPDGSDDGDRGDLRSEESGDEATTLPCWTHGDCPCPGGICLSTGICWCPPCERDEDCPQDWICRSGNCVGWSEQCQPPLRLWPDHGPTTGGTLLTVEGGEFHIGALEWWAVIGEDTFVHPIGYMGEDGYLPCALSFLTPPMPAGTYPVHVFYGWPPFEQPLPEASAAGTITFELFDGPVGHGFCRSNHQCDPFLESCDLGTGRCVPAICRGLVCDDGSSACDHIEGCLDPTFTCGSSGDCKLIRSSCGCHAVHVDDPRTSITSCALGGCEVCSHNHCDTEHIQAACQNGNCIERRGDPSGLTCQSLEPETVPGGMVSDGWIRGVRSASLGDRAALAWTQPEGSPYYRYGIVRVALIDGDGQAQGPIASLSVSYGRDSNPCVATDGSGYGVAWIYEMTRASIGFQRFDLEGSPVGENQTIETNLDPTMTPQILKAPRGFDLFWANDNYGEDDGLYHAEVTSNGGVVGPVDHVSWMVPDSGQMDIVRHRDRFAVAWSNKIYGFEGLYWTEFPLAEAPVWQLAEAGSEVTMAATGQGFAVVWRQSAQGAGSYYSTLHFQSFDQDGKPLTDPIQLAYNRPLAYRPRISYLGGVFLLTWMEQDGYEDDQPGRIKYLQVTENGTRLGEPGELLTASPPPADLFHVRFDDRSAILVGTVEPGDTADTIRFTRFNCSQ
ncbi:MAG TPA: hypothetical protein VM425_00535 [Myxococcota bacterium]|nr:hypothetical protein [Myxococcota bacterium]